MQHTPRAPRYHSTTTQSFTSSVSAVRTDVPSPFGVSEDEQAQHLIRSMLLQNAQPEVGTILWRIFHDITGGGYNPTDPQDNMGMPVRIDPATKELSFNAYKAMTTARASRPGCGPGRG